MASKTLLCKTRIIYIDSIIGYPYTVLMDYHILFSITRRMDDLGGVLGISELFFDRNQSKI